MELSTRQARKQLICKEARLFYQHARVLMARSPFYKSVETQEALDKARDLYRLCREPESVSLKEVSRFTLVIEKYLSRILPHPSNTSYDSSRKRLENLIRESKECLQLN